MSFEFPSNNLSQADLEASNQKPVYAAVAVGLVLATGGVILRFIARRKSKKASYGWDDYMIVIALVSALRLHHTPRSRAPRRGCGGSTNVRTASDSPLCARRRHPSVRDKIWTWPTSARCAFHCRSLPESKYLPCWVAVALD